MVKALRCGRVGSGRQHCPSRIVFELQGLEGLKDLPLIHKSYPRQRLRKSSSVSSRYACNSRLGVGCESVSDV